MDTKKYRLYWREFSGYKGKRMGYKDSSNRWHYGNYTLYKFGYEEVGKDRVKINAERESRDRWVDLWSLITLRDFLDFECTLEAIKMLESKVADYMGKKDFWMEEQPSGITEFILESREKEVKAQEIFTYLRGL